MEAPTIAEFYSGRSVFVTGATGFMGKVLVEKLLRSCPGINKIYVIIRGKKGKNPEDRLKALFQIPLFGRLHSEQPHATDKVVPVIGDMMLPGLGLSEEDRRTLEQEVSVVFHVAATVKFDDPIKSAIFMNVRGTRDVLELASNMKQLKVMLHVSTTYCNTDRRVIEEQFYPAPADWRKIIQAAETLDEGLLQILTAKLIGVRPNTYTYTKVLGEHAVYDYRHKFPTVIFRPSIVISTLEDPISGWMDNFNGPVGLMVAGGKGILRTVYANPDNTADYMPVDMAIKAMVIASWKRANQPPSDDMPVYNASTSNVKRINLSDIYKQSFSLADTCPLNGSLWCPGGGIARTFTEFYIRAMLFHILPAIFVDSALSMMNMKPMLLKLQRKIYIANTALEYFLHHEWTFKHELFLALDDCVKSADRESWSFDFTRVNIREYIKTSFIGGRLYLLKEDDASLPQAHAHYKRMYWLDCIVRTVFYASVGWWVYNSNLLQNIYSTSGSYLSSVLLDS